MENADIPDVTCEWKEADRCFGTGSCPSWTHSRKTITPKVWPQGEGLHQLDSTWKSHW